MTIRHYPVLSRMTCKSLTEDRYGVVQRDMPQIIEALLSFLTAVEEYQVEINSLYTPPLPEQHLSLKALEEKERLRVEVEKAGEILISVGDGTLLSIIIIHARHKTDFSASVSFERGFGAHRAHVSGKAARVQVSSTDSAQTANLSGL